MTTIHEADVVRTLVPTRGDRDIPAGTEGYVVAAYSDGVAIDVEVSGEPDHVNVSIDQVEFVRKGRPIS
ncbi:MAG TPA: hypothetical protein VHC49_26115 [Mycobacteriales bacterium]|nr:hypothetical protein [Mycobacteriales bacterium]